MVKFKLMIGVIGGSGLYEIEGVHIKKIKKVKTPFGSPSDAYIIAEFEDRDVIFLPRHGAKHNIPPHKINYKANIWGFKKLGVDRLLSISATGGISKQMIPGRIVILDQIIDMTRNRDSTFFDGKKGVFHIDFTEPFCCELRASLCNAGKKAGMKLIEKGTYVCVSGPRLETKAEIKFFSKIGADVVGMTSMPEASLARELEICYAGVGVITNYAAGITGAKLTTREVIDVMKATTGKLKELLKHALEIIPVDRKCECKDALKEAGM